MPALKKSNIGKRRETIKINKEFLSKGLETWPCNGQRERHKQIFAALNRSHVRFLVHSGKAHPSVMFLGAGKGETILEFKNFLYQFKIKPIVDVFSLTKSLDPSIKHMVNKDFSRNIPFEHLNIKDSVFKNLINKYDLIVGAMSVGIHTKYPANSLFTSALMLQKGGRAYIEVVDYLKTYWGKSNMKDFKEFCKNSNFDYKVSYQKQISVLEKVFLRMIKSYDSKLEFSIKLLDNSKSLVNKGDFLEIERIK